MINADDTITFTNEYKASALAGAWLHFVAFVASIVVVALLLINMLKNKVGTIAKFATILPVLFMIGSLICSIIMINKGDFDGNINLTICGNILGLISAIATAVVTFLPVKKSKKAKNKKK